ncbi:hypothetical protein [Methanosarcina sp. Kolksee]|uniref:hypothetical protein n=1 Tax=Methanosarcina sp. Kolksee TaxID=1434099 RepID=UPI00064EAABC|nr:hypothetical protein [Methanosarcina sp. Kolksee]
MNNELQMGNSSQDITQNENLRAKDTAPPNITVILPTYYNEEVSIGSMVLQEQELADKAIVVDNSWEDCRSNCRFLERNTCFLTLQHGSFKNSGLKITN